MNVKVFAEHLYEEAKNQEMRNDHVAAYLLRRAARALLVQNTRIESALGALKDGDEIDGI